MYLQFVRKSQERMRKQKNFHISILNSKILKSVILQLEDLASQMQNRLSIYKNYLSS